MSEISRSSHEISRTNQEVSRASQEVSRFLAQPKLAEAIAKAKSDKQAADEALRNVNAYLAKQGVQVPGNMDVNMEPSTSGGTAPKTTITVTISCCPLNIVIVIKF